MLLLMVALNNFNLLEGKNKIEFLYNLKTLNSLTKYFINPITNSNLNFKIAVSSNNRNKDRFSYNRISSKNPDLVLFLGNIITKYSDTISQGDLDDYYNECKYILINLYFYFYLLIFIN